MNKTLCAVLGLVVAVPTARAGIETYEINPEFSSVSFAVRHLLTPVPGRFTRFAGTIQVDCENLERSSVTATIETPSIHTANAQRDTLLRSGDFFLVEQFPQMTFRSTAWKQTGENTFDVTGDLTIKGVAHAVTLKVRSLGFGELDGRKVSAWEATGHLDRRDWGLVGGPTVVGNQVEIAIAIEAVLKP